MSETTHRPIRTFHPRRGRMSTRHHDAIAAVGPRFGLTVVDGDRTPLDLAELFGRQAPTVLEIGFGMGETTAAMAAADPGRDYLAVEVHTPGVGNLLALLRTIGLTNVRVAHGDAMELAHRIAPGVLDAIHVFFPDPWPKARHHKRRLIQPGNVRVLRELLRPGGVLHCATDWPEYAAAIARTLEADPGLYPADPAAHPTETPGPTAHPAETPGPAAHPTQTASPTARPAGKPARAAMGSTAMPAGAAAGADPGPGRPGTSAARPATRFEERGTRAGRPISDLVYLRRGGE
jgi:tRNA (guanine-N7-)-methyltransferase